MGLFNFSSVCFPYCLDKQEDGSFMSCNREYCHLGGDSDTLSRYSFEISEKTKKTYLISRKQNIFFINY